MAASDISDDAFHALNDEVLPSNASRGLGSPQVMSPPSPYHRAGDFAAAAAARATGAATGEQSPLPPHSAVSATVRDYSHGSNNFNHASSHAQLHAAASDDHAPAVVEDEAVDDSAGGPAYSKQIGGICPPSRPAATFMVVMTVLALVVALPLAVVYRPSTHYNPDATPPAPPAPDRPRIPDLTLDYLIGRFNPDNDTDFVQVPPSLCEDGRTDRYVHWTVWDAYAQLNAAAQSELGINLTVVSATRNFDYQRSIWEEKWNTDPAYNNITAGPERALAIMAYSAMPTTSQHHWGCAMDLLSVDPAYFTGTAIGRSVDVWFTARLSKFGFCRPYNAKPPRTAGYDQEQWHVSYRPLLQAVLKAYSTAVTYPDITGFDGSAYAQSIRAIEDYVQTIDPDCLS